MATTGPRPDTPAAPASAPTLRWRRIFPGEAPQLAKLRQWLAALLPACPSRDDIAIAATELASNAIKHTRSGQGRWFAAEITWYSGTVRVAIADCGGDCEPRLINDPGAEHGRGLLVVQGLSVRTGVIGDHRGRAIWADITWRERDLHPAMDVRDSHPAAIRDGLQRSGASALLALASRELTKLARPGTKPPHLSWPCLMRAVTCAPQVRSAGGGLAFRAGLVRRQPAPSAHTQATAGGVR